MVETTLPDGLETSGQKVYRPPPIFFLDKSHFLFKFVTVPLSASVEGVGFSRMQDFSIFNLLTICFAIPNRFEFLNWTAGLQTKSYFRTQIENGTRSMQT